MKNKFFIKKVYAKKNKIYYEYTIDGEEKFKKLFWLGEFFSVEYNESLEGIPESILVIPLLCNILPIIWMNKGTIYLNQIDKTFYKSIKEIKKGYDKMLPTIKLRGKVKSKQRVNNKYTQTNKIATFFSGGVDSFFTLIRNFKESPDLITIWGADVDYENEEGWKVVKKYVEDIGRKYKLKNVLIRASVRRFIDNSELEKQYHDLLQDNWWHAMQHGIGLIGNIAPYAYKHRLKTILIPSTYTKETQVVCASRPEIDNHVRFGSTKVFHEGFESNRQQKVEKICEHVKNNNDKIKLRVCYRSLKGENCCECEKCYRTILSIISQKANPNEFGFMVDKEKMQQIKDVITKTDIIQDDKIKNLWRDIQKQFKREESFWRENEDANWILSLKL